MCACVCGWVCACVHGCACVVRGCVGVAALSSSNSSRSSTWIPLKPIIDHKVTKRAQAKSFSSIFPAIVNFQRSVIQTGFYSRRGPRNWQRMMTELEHFFFLF